MLFGTCLLGLGFAYAYQKQNEQTIRNQNGKCISIQFLFWVLIFTEDTEAGR